MYIIIIFLLILIGYSEYKYNNLKKEYILFIENKEKEIKRAREESIRMSKSTIRGLINEEFIPLFPDFPYELSDCKFSGQPIDYIVFDGMSKLRDGDKLSKINIIIADVKVNNSKETMIQLAIKNAIENDRIRFETWNIKNNKIIIK